MLLGVAECEDVEDGLLCTKYLNEHCVLLKDLFGSDEVLVGLEGCLIVPFPGMIARGNFFELLIEVLGLVQVVNAAYLNCCFVRENDLFLSGESEELAVKLVDHSQNAQSEDAQVSFVYDIGQTIHVPLLDMNTVRYPICLSQSKL